MTRLRDRFLYSALLLILDTTPAAAQNWDWTYTFSSPAHVDAHPVTLSPSNADGFWAIGDSLLHYHADGSLDFATGEGAAGTVYAGRSGYLSNGGLVFVSQPIIFNEYPRYCTITAYSAQGIARWQQTFGAYLGCDMGIDGRDTIWVVQSQHGDPLLGFSADGARQISYSTFDEFQQSIASFAVDLREGGVFLATDSTPATIVSLDASGATQWSWTDNTASYSFATITVGADGNLYAVARSQDTGLLSIVSLTPDGALRFVHTPSTVQFLNVLGTAAAPDGGLYIADSVRDANDATEIALQRIGADGGLLWSHSLGKETYCQAESHCDLTVTPAGDVLITLASSSAPKQLLRYDSDGDLLFAHALDYPVVGSVVSLANGDVLATQGSDSADPLTFHYLELDRAGNVAPAPVTVQVLGASTDGGVSTFAEDGTAFVWVDDYAVGPSLARISPSGQLLWKTPSAGTAVSAYALSAGGNRVCVGEDRAAQPFFYAPSIACFDADTGEQVWSVELDAAFFGYGRSPLQVLADGSVVVLHRSASGRSEHLRFDANGAFMHRVGILGVYYFATTANGRSAIITVDGTLVSYDVNGRAIYTIPIAPELLPEFDLNLSVFADGSALVTADVEGTSTINPYAWLINADGKTRWLKPLHGATFSGDYILGSQSLAGSDGKLYFNFSSQNSNFYTLQARAALTGDLIWENAKTSGNALLEDPVTKRLVVVGPVNGKLSISTIAANSGATLTEAYESCPADAPPGEYPYCLWNRFAISRDGTLRADAAVHKLVSPGTRQLFASRNAGSPRVPIRLDQAGIDGAWFAPYESGQGFTLDYIASGATIFMPWFTYTKVGGNDPAGLAWYTLQGTVEPGATSADLGIAETDPGSFNSDIVGSHAVGTAHLSFSDCNSGSLYYQFNADTNNGAGGLITLTRLSPSTSPCVLTDGGLTPAQIANAPEQGFDARQSGSWFDPSTSGQGLEMTIIPPGSGFGGLVFAAWFTFDPAERSDDPAHQHWFTLQGDLSSVSDGTVTLPILRTIGGTFDGLSTGNIIQVGHATLTMQGCDKARLDYQFDQSEVAYIFAGLSGTTNLVKIGGCTAP